MTTLRLWIEPNWPDNGQVCPWALCDAAGRVIEAGCSEPARWPAAEAVLAILAPVQVGQLLMRVPERLLSRPTALAYALEDRVAEDAANLHVVAGRQIDGLTPVFVVNKFRLERVLRALSEAGRPARHACGAEMLAGGTADEWRADLHAGGGVLRMGDGATMHLDLADDGGPPAALALAVERARAGQSAPSRILWAGTSAIDARRWSDQLGVPVEECASLDWQQAAFDSQADLLRHDFLPSEARWGRGRWFRLAGASLLLAVGLTWVAVAAHWVESHWRLKALRAEQASLAAAALPAGTPLLDPLRQVRQAADMARWRAGEATSYDWLPLYARWIAAGGGGIAPYRLSYDHKQLALTLPADRQAEISATVLRLRAQGMEAFWQSAPEGDRGVVVISGEIP